jgi:hypothetical protein
MPALFLLKRVNGVVSYTFYINLIMTILLFVYSDGNMQMMIIIKTIKEEIGKR